MKKIIAMLLILFIACPVWADNSNVLSVVARKKAGGGGGDGWVGNDSVDGYLYVNSTGDWFYGADGFTPTSTGTVSYMHVQFYSGIVSKDAKMALYDSSKNKVAETAVFTANTGTFNVALSSSYTLTNQTYYLAVAGEDSGFNLSTISAQSFGTNKDNNNSTSTAPDPLGNDESLSTTQVPRIWATNTSDGS